MGFDKNFVKDVESKVDTALAQIARKEDPAERVVPQVRF